MYDLRDVAKHVYGGEPEAVRDLNLTQERAHLSKVQREKIEIELAAMREEYVPVGAVLDAWTTVCIQYRDNLLTLENKIKEFSAAGFIGDDIGDEFCDYINDGLVELSRFDPLGAEPAPDDTVGTESDSTETAADG